MIAASTGFSTNMMGFLDIAGRRVPLGQLGPAHCIVRESLSIPPGKAEILVITDGRESRLPVYLPNGIAPDQPRVIYQSLNHNTDNARS
jgi:hypothetical protein